MPLGQQSSTRECTTRLATVVVHVDDVRGQVSLLRDLVDVAHAGQSRVDVEELGVPRFRAECGLEVSISGGYRRCPRSAIYRCRDGAQFAVAMP